MSMCLLFGNYRVLLVYFALPIAANPWSPISSVFWPVSSVFIGTKSCSLVKTFFIPLLVAGSSRWQPRTTTSLFWAILLAYWKSGYLLQTSGWKLHFCVLKCKLTMNEQSLSALGVVMPALQSGTASHPGCRQGELMGARPITEQYHFWGALRAQPMRMLHQRNRNGLD